jgi:hypothetical protein
MMNQNSVLPLQEAKDYIMHLDFTNIQNRLVAKHKWRPAEAAEAAKVYRRFLYLVKKYGDSSRLSPSEEIDEFWHYHILDTERYIKDCEMIFGKYLNHYPGKFTSQGAVYDPLHEEGFARTQDFYYQEFDDYIYEIRNPWYIRWVNHTLKLGFKLYQAIRRLKRRWIRGVQA